MRVKRCPFCTYDHTIGPLCKYAGEHIFQVAALAAEQPQPVPKAVATAPPRIWLQIGSDRDHLDEPFPSGAEAEVTWCSDSVGDAEVEYVRADIAAPPPPAAEPSARDMECDAVDALVENGWTWDGDQWQRPPPAAEPITDAMVEAAFIALHGAPSDYMFTASMRVDAKERVRAALAAAAKARNTNPA